MQFSVLFGQCCKRDRSGCGSSSGGFIGFSDTKYAWFDRQAILQGRVEPHPIQAPDGFDGRVALSPDGEFLFMSPNHLINLRNKSVSYEFSYSESGGTEFLVSGIHLANTLPASMLTAAKRAKRKFKFTRLLIKALTH